MSRSKADIQAAINTQQAKVTAQRAKIEKLSSALKSLQSAEIKAEWKAKSHSNIKSTYHLAGIPYKDMSDHEGESDTSIITVFNKALKAKQDEMIEIVSSALNTANQLGINYECGLAALKSELANAKD